MGVCGDDARALNRGYLKRLSDGLPLVTLKTAITTDGRIATESGESQWITGAESRAEAHRLRADHDAVAVASATATADDPELTCRLPGMHDRSPVRVLLDAHLRVPTDAKLYATAHDVPLWVFSAVPPDDPKVLERTNTGAEHFTVATDGSGHGVNLRQSLRPACAARHHTSFGRSWRDARQRVAAGWPGRRSRRISRAQAARW